MLQRQDKYLLHSCNSRLLYQTCGNGFALGSYGILYSANIFFLSRDPAGSWFQLHFLSRVQWNPGSCVKCCLGIQVTHPFLSFNNMSYEESMLDKLTSLAWRGLSNAADAKKKNEKSIWSWMDNFTKWAFRDHSMSVQGRPRSPVEKFQTVYVWVRRVRCACSDQFLSDMHKSMYRKFWFYGHWSKLDKGCLNPVKWNVYISFLNSGKARPKSMFQIFTWNLSNNIFMCIFNMPKHTFITLEIMS